MTRLNISSKTGIPLDIKVSKEKDETFLIQIKSGARVGSVRKLNAAQIINYPREIILDYSNRDLMEKDLKKLKGLMNVDIQVEEPIDEKLYLQFPIKTQIHYSEAYKL